MPRVRKAPPVDTSGPTISATDPDPDPAPTTSRRDGDGDHSANAGARLPASVLVIDDSASDRRLLTEILQELRSDVLVATAATLADARQALSEASFEMVLLDLGLSDAKELEGLLILSDVAPTTPIVVVTAHPDKSYVYAALNRGADEYLSKSDLDEVHVRDTLLRAIYRRTGRRRYNRLGAVAHRSLNSHLAPAATLDGTGRIAAVNDAWEEAAREGGTTLRATGVGVNYLTVCRQAVGEYSDGAAEVADGIESVLSGERDRFSLDYPFVIDEEERWFTVRVLPLRHRGGGAVVTHVDVTDATRAENDVRQLALEFESNNELSLSLVHDHATQLFGYAADDVLGKTSPEFRLRPESMRTIDAAVMTSGRWEGDFDARRADGSTVPVHTIVERIEAPDISFEGIVSASIDVTDRRELQEALEFQLRHDVLTRLPNRLLLVEHLERELESRRASATPLAVLVVDFDDFKEVNDQFGHAVGDDVLQTWSTIVTELLPDGDLLARLAGNKFAVASSSATTVEDARYLAQRICDVTAQPMNIGDDSIPSLAVSVGVALSVPESRADRLIRNADVAVYAAKENGSAQIELFDDSYHDMVRERNNLRIELAKAVSADEIMAYFQPEVDLRSGAIVGFEALARWHHRERGAISPEEFIPLAEQSGLIGRIGVTMLEASCRALRHWEELSPGRGISMAVNVSALQLLDPLFPDAVREICAHVGVNPEHLCLELTESALIEEAAAFHALNELKGVGVKIALDDFGTGYSSLRRLNRYPLDFLKIDQSFVSELKSRQRDSVIITAVMGIARALSFETVGEGIETELQRRRLIEMDCRVGQGFLFSEAVPLEAATALIANDVHYELEGTTA